MNFAETVGKELPGPNVLLMGPAGTGKTYSLGTLVETGLEVFYLGLEPGLESLMGYFTDAGKPVPDNLHWHQLAAPSASLSELIDSATKINTLSFESITKMQDPFRSKHNQFIGMLTALNDFPDDRTGVKFGPVNTWPANRVLAIDSLTGINRAAMAMVVGGKPAKNMADWGLAQDQTEKILQLLCNNCPCWFVLIAHVERETDLILGGSKITVSTLGRALAPKIPPMFSDVILTVREGTNWYWDTASALADVKTRNLTINPKNLPTFKAIAEKWQTRGGKL